MPLSGTDVVDLHGVQAYLRSKWLVTYIDRWFPPLQRMTHHLMARANAGEHVGAAATLSAFAELVEVGLHGPVGVTAAVAAYDLYP